MTLHHTTGKSNVQTSTGVLALDLIAEVVGLGKCRPFQPDGIASGHVPPGTMQVGPGAMWSECWYASTYDRPRSPAIFGDLRTLSRPGIHIVHAGSIYAMTDDKVASPPSHPHRTMNGLPAASSLSIEERESAPP